MAQVQVVVFDGVDELDFVGPFEVLASVAGRAADGSAVELVALETPRLVRTARGMRVLVETPLRQRGDVLVVPGGGWAAGGADGVRGEVAREALPAALAEAAEGHPLVASVCTGAILLAEAGLLRGRPASTHHSAVADLAERGARPLDARVVDDGDLVTAGGVTSGIDLALHLAARLWGREAAEREARRIEHTPQPARVVG